MDYKLKILLSLITAFILIFLLSIFIKDEEQVLSFEHFMKTYKIKNVNTDQKIEGSYENKYVSNKQVDEYFIYGDEQHYIVSLNRELSGNYSDNFVLRNRVLNLSFKNEQIEEEINFKHERSTSFIEQLKLCGDPYTTVNYLTNIKDDYFSIIIIEEGGWICSENNTVYTIYNFNKERLINNNELINNFNINDYDKLLETKVKDYLLKELYINYSNIFMEEKINYKLIINKYNEIIKQKDKWDLFINEVGGLSVIVNFETEFIYNNETYLVSNRPIIIKLT